MSFQKLQTPWFDSVGDHPWQEYPRPQFVRDSYFNLNGLWDYAITSSRTRPTQFDGKILVPFSPESQLSRVERFVSDKDFLHYKREFSLEEGFNCGRVMLNFGAVDSSCEVFVDGKSVGSHDGGYNSFTFDVTEALAESNPHELYVVVTDPTDTGFVANGKQSTSRGGMWYTPQSGIWQTVWMESVPDGYLKNVIITPDFDNASVSFDVDCDKVVKAVVLDNGKEVASAEGSGKIVVKFEKGFTAWSPEEPHLYDVVFTCGKDVVKSYFGMRKFGVTCVDGVNRITLNNKPYFMNGLLDQGYWCDGLYTAPCDEALVYDVSKMKELGFNMLRKHIKVEPMRWYYHCDRLGMIVWQDMPSGGTKQHKSATLILPNVGIDKIKDNKYKLFSRETQESRDLYIKEYKEMLSALQNVTSIAVWVPFNEGWGQFDANKIALLTKETDGTRLVDHASGWHDQGGGDFLSQHVYFKKVRLKRDGRVTVLSEFGGYTYKETEHSFNLGNTYSYKNFPDKASFNQALEKLYKRDVIAQIEKGLSAAVYTQVSDVEDEVNGILTYDRKIVKVDEEMMKRINKEVRL